MNSRTVNISSLVILLSLLAFILEACIYYFVPMHMITVIVACICTLLLSHFFLESSLNYDYNFLHTAFMTVSTLAFSSIIYIVQPNQWISYDYTLILLVLCNWLVPYIYCCIRDLFDRGPRFDGYQVFFHRMSIFFIVIYMGVIAKQYFITPIEPPYEELVFGAHNFVPFMATGQYVEDALRTGIDLTPMILFALELMVIGIPYGYFAAVYLRKLPFIGRLVIYMTFPALLEFIQDVTGIGRCDIDDYMFFLMGTIIGIIIYHIINSIYKASASREFMLSRSQRLKYFY